MSARVLLVCDHKNLLGGVCPRVYETDLATMTEQTQRAGAGLTQAFIANPIETARFYAESQDWSSARTHPGTGYDLCPEHSQH